MSEPKIWTKNYVSKDDAITVSHGDGTKSYLYDRDNDSKWTTSGANSDATMASVEIVFYEGTTAINRTISRLLLINHNLKNWTFYYWNGSSWVSLAGETVDAADTTLKTFGAVTTSKVKLECDATQVADAEKHIGEMIVAAEQMDVGHDLSDLSVSYKERTRIQQMGDGSEHQMVTMWTPNRATRYSARARIQFLATAGHDPETERITLKSIIDARQPFLWYPESSFRPGEIFFVRCRNPWAEKYVSSYKGAGFEVNLDLAEV